MIIEVNNLKKSYKNQVVLKDINIKIEEPKIIALVGPNGAGKTTLLDCMTNLLQPDSGNVRLLEKSVTDHSLFYEVSYFQDNRVLYGDLTGREQLEFICRVQKLPPSNVNRVAKKLKIEGYLDKKVKKYSLGMKQHLLLAIAIINNPKILILDEPLNGLDPSSSIKVRNLLLDLHKQGTTILISSHNLDEIDRLTNDIFFMKNGELLIESISMLEKEYYVIEVNDTTTLKEALKSDYQDAISIHNTTIQLNPLEMPLNSILHKLFDLDIEILDIKKVKLGAEKRYQDLYREIHDNDSIKI